MLESRKTMVTDSEDQRKLKVKPPMRKPETILKVVQRYVRYPDPLPHSMLPKDYFFSPWHEEWRFTLWKSKTEYLWIEEPQEGLRKGNTVPKMGTTNLCILKTGSRLLPLPLVSSQNRDGQVQIDQVGL